MTDARSLRYEVEARVLGPGVSEGDARRATIRLDASPVQGDEPPERPPRLTRIHYELRLVTDEPAERIELLHRNLATLEAVSNTLASACEGTGEVVAERRETPGGAYVASSR